ncbi:putative bifunctional diguanylate cyclase/phosphodiesterase [Pseudoduganella rivuli]|nr:bifunctional diguanylate cyclase/phosphodiesterase [Pseudoduganella rivuli]
MPGARYDHDGRDVSAAAPLRVLLIEDDEDDAALLLLALDNAFGLLDSACVDSLAGLRAALSLPGRWDVVICDHTLPGFDARAALAAAQAFGNTAPFIIVSGSMSESDAVAAIEAGAADMISKDRLPRLLPVIRREMQKSRAASDFQLVQAQLRQLACYDEVTGLPKRDFLAAQMAALPGAQVAVALISISRFSHIGRSLGMAAADEVRAQVASRLRKSVGSAGVVGALEAGRFALLLSGSDPAQLADEMARISNETGWPLRIGEQEVFVGLRIGVSLYPRDNSQFNALLVQAALAMSQVKVGCRHNIVFFDPAMEMRGNARWQMEQALHHALRNDEFVLHYQPQVAAGDGAIVGVEALLRWQQPGHGLVAPSAFIDLLEETGLIVAAGEWVLRTACRQFMAWKGVGVRLQRMAVNLSALQFSDSDLVPMVRRILAETGMDAHCLELEITEGIAMDNEDAVFDKLRQLRAMGICLAIDDFGTGYSNLGYLHRLPVNRIKIDQSFVRAIDARTPDSPIVRAIVTLARSLAFDVLAEGVETPLQAQFLDGCGCGEHQGYLYGKPLPAAEMMPLLLQGACGIAGVYSPDQPVCCPPG